MSLKEFVPIQKIGQGSFASVYKVRRLIDQQIYALKKINMKCLDQKAKNNALNQIRLLACLQSPYIITYYESFFEQKLDLLCIGMQFADGGDLSHLIKKYKKQKKLVPEIQIWKILIHLLYGLSYLHQKKILHRDLKSQNIFISKGIYKIGDMNVSKINKHGLAITQTGTPYYASPQIWNDLPYDQKCDIWSLGCIIYELAALKPPFQGANMQVLYDNITKGKVSQIPKTYSNQLYSIIKTCLKQNPLQRPSSNELLQNWTVKIYQNLCIQFRPQENVQSKQLLRTIYMPKYKNQLKSRLPQSNYKNNSNQNFDRLQQKTSQIKTNIKQSQKQKLECKQLKLQKANSQNLQYKNVVSAKKQVIKNYQMKETRALSQIKLQKNIPFVAKENKQKQAKKQNKLSQLFGSQNQVASLFKRQQKYLNQRSNIICSEVLFEKINLVKQQKQKQKQKQKVKDIVKEYQNKAQQQQYTRQKSIQIVQRFSLRKIWQAKLWSFCAINSIKNIGNVEKKETISQKYYIIRFGSQQTFTQYKQQPKISTQIKKKKRCISLPKTQKISRTYSSKEDSTSKATSKPSAELNVNMRVHAQNIINLNDIICRKINFDNEPATILAKNMCKNQQRKIAQKKINKQQSNTDRHSNSSSRKGIFRSNGLIQKQNIKCVSQLNSKINDKKKIKNIVEVVATNLQRKLVEKQISKYLFC